MKVRRRPPKAAATEAIFRSVGRDAVIAEAKRAGWKPGEPRPHSFWRELADMIEQQKAKSE